MPSPLMKASASARAKVSAMRLASQPSTSKAASSRSRWLALGSADSSWSGILIRATCASSSPVRETVSDDQPKPREP